MDSGHVKYLCIKASEVSWQNEDKKHLAGREWEDIYLKCVFASACWKDDCLFIRAACDLFSMLTQHDVLGIQWSGMNGRVF